LDGVPRQREVESGERTANLTNMQRVHRKGNGTETLYSQPWDSYGTQSQDHPQLHALHTTRSQRESTQCRSCERSDHKSQERAAFTVDEVREMVEMTRTMCHLSSRDKGHVARRCRTQGVTCEEDRGHYGDATPSRLPAK